MRFRARLVDRGGNALPYAASDDIDILVMHDGEEPGAKVGTRLPAVLFGDSADQGVLDEVVRPWPVAGQRAGVAPQPQDFFFEKPAKIAHSSPPSLQRRLRGGRANGGASAISIRVKPNPSEPSAPLLSRERAPCRLR